MDYNLNNQNKSPIISYYKTKYKKKSESSISNNNNNPSYANDIFNKSSLKPKVDFKFRTSKNSPLYTKRKIEVNEEINSGLFSGRLKNNQNNNEDLFTNKMKKLYKKANQFSQIHMHNNSSNLINNSKNDSSSIIVNKFSKTKKLFYNNYNDSNFDYNSKLNHYLVNNNSGEENNINNNINNNPGSLSLRQNDKNYLNNFGLIKHLENKENKTINDTLLKKISTTKQNKHQSMTKMKKISGIHYLYNNHTNMTNTNNISNNINNNINFQQQNEYTKYLKKYNDNNNGINLINKKLNKMLNPTNYNNSFLDNKLSKTAYLAKNNSGKNSLDKKNNIKNNYNLYCYNSKLIQRNDDKIINSINNINNNNESSRALYDSMNKKIKTNINNGINYSNNKNLTKGTNNFSQIYVLDNNNNRINVENIYNNKINEKNNKIIEKDISIYNYINSKKNFYHTKSTPDISTNNSKIISSNNPIKSTQFSSLSNNNKVNNLQNLNLKNISNKINNFSDNNNYNSNTNRTNNDNKSIHFRSNSNIINNNINNNNSNSKEASDIIYKKKISLKPKDRVKSSSIYLNNKDKSKSNSQIENEESLGNKIKNNVGALSKQESIKTKLIKNLLPFSNYQSPLDKSYKKKLNNYLLDSKRMKDVKNINKDGDIENDNYNENKSTNLINNNYYIGINLDKKIINNICHTFRENNNYFNCNLISNNNNSSNNNNQPDIKSENNNLIIINDNNNINNNKNNNFINNNEDNEKMSNKENIRKKYKHYNSQELIKGIKKDIKIINNKLITIELNKKDYKKRKLIDKKITIKEKEENNEINSKGKTDYKNQYNNDMIYIPPDKELKQDTIHLTTTASLDCYYYKNEKEKLSKYIKNYFNQNGVYPETQKNFYLYGRQIGHGAFGKVNIALHVASGRLVAIKTFNKKNLKKKNAKQKIKNEIEMLSRLRHPFISQILDSFETDTHIFIVMEYICGDLLGFIRKRGKLSETVSKIIFKQLIEGLKYIHHKKIVHRDIKLDNILIDLTNTIKICDFGVSRKISSDEIMHEHCGTPAYIAPEIFENKGYSGFQCDIWSAGVTLYYILGGIQPFRASSIKDLEKKVVVGDFEPIEEVSEEANDLINLILKTDPTKRINEDKILNHPWLANIKTENRKKLNLFTDAEKILLSKYDVDYLTSDKEELIENFTMRNLETNENENIKKAVGGTKSVIYAPYNTYIDPNEDQSKYKSDLEIKNIYKEIETDNDICKYGFKVQQANIKYELSNNQDFDNGIIKTQKDEDLKQENEKIEKLDFKKIQEDNNKISYKKKYKSKSPNESFEENDIITINEKIIYDIEKTVGYDKRYVIDCLRKNVINYATATYHLLYREYEKNNNE